MFKLAVYTLARVPFEYLLRHESRNKWVVFNCWLERRVKAMILEVFGTTNETSLSEQGAGRRKAG